MNTAGSKEQYSLFYVLENPSLEELASFRSLNIDSLISLVTPINRIPDLINWVQGRGETCGTDLRTNSSVSTQIFQALNNRRICDQMEISYQYTQPHLIEPPADQEISDSTEEADSDVEIITDSHLATRGRPRESRNLPLQILEIAKLYNEEMELDTNM